MDSEEIAKEIVDDIRNMPVLSSKETYQKNMNKITDFVKQIVIEELEWITANKDSKEIAFRALARLDNLK